MRINWFRVALALYTGIAAIGHASRANAALDGPIKPLPATHAVRQGPTLYGYYPEQSLSIAEARRRTVNPLSSSITTYQVKSGSGALIVTATSLEQCLQIPQDRLRAQAATTTSGSNVLSCAVSVKFSTAFQPPVSLTTYNYIAKFTTQTTTPPPTCPAPPPVQTRPGACPTGSASNWTQTGTTTYGPAPTCAPTVTWTPSVPPVGGCLPITPIGGTATLPWTHDGLNTTEYRVRYWREGQIATEVRIPGNTARSYTITGLTPGTWSMFVSAANCPPNAGCSVSPASATRQKVIQ
jgi:hypothetical protein